MKFNIDDLIKSFETKSKKHKRKSDKYSIIRQKLINYLIANQNNVMMKLSKN